MGGVLIPVMREGLCLASLRQLLQSNSHPSRVPLHPLLPCDGFSKGCKGIGPRGLNGGSSLGQGRRLHDHFIGREGAGQRDEVTLRKHMASGLLPSLGRGDSWIGVWRDSYSGWGKSGLRSGYLRRRCHRDVVFDILRSISHACIITFSTWCHRR